MKNILLTGASGTVGYEVLKQLIAKDQFNITVFDVENPASRKKFESLPKKFQLIYGDLTKREDVNKIPPNQDAVIHLAALIPPVADEKPNLAERINVQGTENLLKSLENGSPNAFFIYSSSISVYGDRLENPDIKVGDELKPSVGDHYAETKIKAEELIQNSALEWTIFRLAAIMGNHKISKLMFHMPLETSVEICTPSDTARAFVHSLAHRAALKGRIFNLGGGENCRLKYRELLSKSFDIFGLGKLNFPPKAFAEKNFHCGNYADGDDLENIIHFRKDNLNDYFAMVERGVNPLTRNLTKLASPIVKRYLLRQSEPYEAWKKGDAQAIHRFFN